MANQEHLDILRQGVDVWNTWRKRHLDEQPDLRGANISGDNLRGAYVKGADISGANLRHTDLSLADLSDADLSRADLSSADLSSANLSSVNLSHAILSNTNLSHTNLGGANLSRANLGGANLSRTNLGSADLTDATAGWTTFGNLDLRNAKGLETIRHRSPSTIGFDTIYHSGGNIPDTNLHSEEQSFSEPSSGFDPVTIAFLNASRYEVFLRGAGIDDTFITYMHSLVGKPIEYNSCFISYSSKDQEFAERLYSDLQSKNVRCWYAPEDLEIGGRIRLRIHEQIWFNDRLLLILSESSVASEWVDYEVETALARERKEKRNILFPIRLDNAVKESAAAWAAHVQSARHIGNFTRWKEHDEYQKGLTRLLRDLKQEAIHDTIENDADQDEKQSTSRETQSS